MKNRLISILILITIFCTMILCTPMGASAEEEAILVSIDIENSRIGNAYYDGEAPVFSFTLESRFEAEKEMSLTYHISNDMGEKIYNETKNITFGAKQKRIIGYAPDLNGKYGVYTLTASLSCEGCNAEASVNFSHTKRAGNALDSLGYMCHFTKSSDDYARVEKSEELLRESGAGWVRDEIGWSATEKVKGKYVIPESVEKSVNGAIASGKKVLLLVSGGNTLYETGYGPNGEAISCLPVTDAGRQGFANFCAYVAEHFKGRVDTFEIWNEPDWTGFNGHYDWLPNDTSAGWRNLAVKSAEAYANLIKVVYPAIKNVYRGEEDKVTVVSGGCLPVKSDTGYLQRMLSAEGVQNYIDAVGVHPYARDGIPGDMCSGDAQDFTQQMRRVKSYTDKPIYITEYGASSFGDSTNGGNDGESAFTGYGILGVRGQALGLVRTFMVVAQDPQIEKLFVYNFKEKGKDPNIEANFGVVGYDYAPKGAYVALSTMSSILGNAETANPIEANETNYAYGDRAKAYEFVDKKSGDEIFVVAAGGSAFEWGTKLKITEELDIKTGNANAVLDNTAKTVTVNAYKGGTVKVLDIMGNEIKPQNGVYPIYLAPMYVICSKSTETEIINGDTVKVKGCADAETEVTAVVYKKNIIGQNVAFVDQVRADSNGRFEFSFEKTKGDIYEVMIYNGAAYKNGNCGTNEYDFDIKYYVDGVELRDASDIKSGTTVKLEMEITDKNGTGEGLMAYGCVYNDSSVIVDADTSASEWVNNKTVMSSEIEIGETCDAESLKFMLWDNNMRPVLNNIKVQIAE